MAAEQIFVWSEKEISLRRLVEEFQRQFPVVAMTTCGYTGADSVLHEIGYGEVYWIFAVQRQQRVVAKDNNFRYLSIPVESHFRFQQQKRDTQALSRPMTLVEVIASGCCGQQIVFERNQSVTFLLGADSRSTTQFGVIEVMDSYDEKYLLGRLVLASGELCDEVVAIPVYMPIRLSVAQSLKDGDEDHFRSWKESLMEEEEEKEHRADDQVALCKEILIFEELPNNAYEYINPSVYVKTLAQNANQSKKQAAKPPPTSTKAQKQSCATSSQRGESSFGSDSAFTPEGAKARTSGGEGKTPKSKGISITKEGISITKEGISNTKEDKLSIYENVSSSLEVPALPVRTVPKLKKEEDYANMAAGPLKIPTYENTQTIPVIPQRTLPRDKPPVYDRSYPAKPPPRSKKPPVPMTRETVTPQLSNPLLPTPAKPQFLKQQSEPGYNAWKSLRDVPRDVDVSSLTVDGVARCIQLLGFEDKVDVFKKEDVDGRLLLALDENTLIRDFGFRAIEAKKVLLFASEGWQPKVTET